MSDSESYQVFMQGSLLQLQDVFTAAMSQGRVDVALEAVKERNTFMRDMVPVSHGAKVKRLEYITDKLQHHVLDGARFMCPGDPPLETKEDENE